MIQYFPIVTGSLTVLGNINVSGSINTSGSITISGSITSASFATSASNATNAISASYANNLTVAGTLTAQTLVVQTITSSVDFVTGSTRFGSILDNTHVFTGSVGISGSLNIVGNSIFTGSVSTTGTGFFGSDVFTYNNGGIFFSGGGVYASGIFQNSSNSLVLQTGTTPRLTISASGAVGIGTTTPIANLDVSSANTTAFFRVGSTSSGTAGSIDMYTSGTGGFQAGTVGFNTANNVNFLFNIGGTERMRISSTGNVGIGTSSPTYKLDVSGSNGTYIRVAETNGAEGYGAGVRAVAGSTDFGFVVADGLFSLYDFGGGGRRLSITSGGKVGMGNSNPNNLLDVYGSGSNTVGLFGARSSGGGTFITGRMVSAETANQTLTIASFATGGTNERIFVKIHVLNVSAVSDYGNSHVGYALWSKNGTKSVTTMTLDSGNSSISNASVGSLSWSGNDLQYTTNRAGNYEMNHITIWGVARDSGVIS